MKMGFALPATGDAELEAIWGKKHKQKYAKKPAKDGQETNLARRGRRGHLV